MHGKGSTTDPFANLSNFEAFGDSHPGQERLPSIYGGGLGDPFEITQNPIANKIPTARDSQPKQLPSEQTKAAKAAHFSEQLVTEVKGALFGGHTLHPSQPDKYSSSTQAMSSLLKRSKSMHQSPAGSRRNSSSSSHETHALAAAVARRKAHEHLVKDLVSQFRILRSKMASFIQVVTVAHSSSQESMRLISGGVGASTMASIRASQQIESRETSTVSTLSPSRGNSLVPTGVSPKGFDLSPSSTRRGTITTKDRVPTLLNSFWEMMSVYSGIEMRQQASTYPPPTGTSRNASPKKVPPTDPFPQGGSVDRFVRKDPHMLVMSNWHCSGPSSAFTHASGPKARSAALLQSEVCDEGISPTPSPPRRRTTADLGMSTPLSLGNESVNLLTTPGVPPQSPFHISEARLLDEALYSKKEDLHQQTPPSSSALEGSPMTPFSHPGKAFSPAPATLPKLADEVKSAAFTFDISCALRKAWHLQKMHVENVLLDSGLPPGHDDSTQDEKGLSSDSIFSLRDSPETTPTSTSKPQHSLVMGVASTEEWIDDSLEFLRMIDTHIAALEKTVPSAGSQQLAIRHNSMTDEIKALPNFEDSGDFHLFPCSVLMYLFCYEGLAKLPPPPLEGVLIFKGYTRPLTVDEERQREETMWKQIEAISKGEGGSLQPSIMQNVHPSLGSPDRFISGASAVTQHWVILSALTASLPGGASIKKIRQLSTLSKLHAKRTSGSVSIFGGSSNGVSVPKISPGLKEVALPFCSIGIEGLLVLMEYLATGGRGLGANGEVESSSDDDSSDQLVIMSSSDKSSPQPHSHSFSGRGSQLKRGVQRTTINASAPHIQTEATWGNIACNSKITARITLSTLDLSYNRIDHHCLAVLKAFLPHTFITALSLRHNDLGAATGEDQVAFLLEDECALESLDLSFTSLSTSAKASIIRSISRSQLLSLSLEGLQFSASEAIALFHSVSSNSTLLSLSLLFNGSCGSKGYVQRIKDVLHRNTRRLEARFIKAASELVQHSVQRSEITLASRKIPSRPSNSQSPPSSRAASFRGVRREGGALGDGYKEYTTNNPTSPRWLTNIK